MALVNELLEGLFGVGHHAQRGRQAHPLGEGFNGFAFALQEQPAQVDLTPEGLARAVEVRTKTFGVRLQTFEHGGPKPGRESAVHARALLTHKNRVASTDNLTE